MDSGGRDWRYIVWQLLKPALVAVILALLLALGVTGLRQPAVTGVQVGVATVGTHFTGPVFVGKGLTVTGPITASTVVSESNGFSSTAGFDVVGNITMTDGYLINSKGAVTVTDALKVTGALNVAGATNLVSAVTSAGAIVGANLAVGAFWQPGVQTGIVVAASGWITPTGTYQPISAAAWVTPTLNVSAGVVGYWVTLVNSGTMQICLVDTGNVMLSADWTGGQYDTLTLLHDGSHWLELARSNN